MIEISNKIIKAYEKWSEVNSKVPDEKGETDYKYFKRREKRVFLEFKRECEKENLTTFEAINLLI